MLTAGSRAGVTLLSKLITASAPPMFGSSAVPNSVPTTAVCAVHVALPLVVVVPFSCTPSPSASKSLVIKTLALAVDAPAPIRMLQAKLVFRSRVMGCVFAEFLLR